MKLYRLYIAKPLLIFYLLMFGVWTVVPIILIIVGAMGKLGSEGPPIWIFVILALLWFFRVLYVAQDTV